MNECSPCNHSRCKGARSRNRFRKQHNYDISPLWTRQGATTTVWPRTTPRKSNAAAAEINEILKLKTPCGVFSQTDCVGYASVDVVVEVYSHPSSVQYSRCTWVKSRHFAQYPEINGNGGIPRKPSICWGNLDSYSPFSCNRTGAWQFFERRVHWVQQLI